MYVCLYIYIYAYIYIYIYIYICVWDTRHWGPTNPTRIIRPWNVHLEELHLFRLNVICLECDKISCASAGEAVPQLFSALRMGWFRFRISDLHVLLSLCVCVCVYPPTPAVSRGRASEEALLATRCQKGRRVCAERKPAPGGHEQGGSWQCRNAGKVKVWS